MTSGLPTTHAESLHFAKDCLWVLKEVDGRDSISRGSIHPEQIFYRHCHIRAVRIGFPFDPTNERRWFSGSLNSFTGNLSLKTCVHHRRTLYVNGFARRVRLRANTIGTQVR